MNEEKLHQLLGKMVTELGAAVMGAHIIIGDKLGLYKALSSNGGLTSLQLSEKTGTTERYVREWLAAQAASGYIEYNAENSTFSLSPEQHMVFADDDSPANMVGGFYGIESVYTSEAKLTEAFKSGDGFGWGDHTNCLFCGTEKFFRPGYTANLVSNWLPALDGVVTKLEVGARVADVGCGHGVSTILMAEAFPNSTFFGYDFHEPSIKRARELAVEAGITNATFEVATAKEFPGKNYDLVACFDCLHDMGDPVGAAAHIRSVIKDDGTWLIVEPMAGDSLLDNLNPVGRVYYAFSTVICVPTSLDQEVGLALGAQAGEANIRKVVTDGGFSTLNRATETPFNLILEARP